MSTSRGWGMADWRRERLGDHAHIGARIGWRGLSADEYVDSGPFLIAGKHIVSSSVDWAGCDHLTEDRYRESPEIALQVGDVIISKDGTIGRVARIDSLPGPATLNGTMMLVRPTGSLDHRYLSHLLNGSAFKKLVEERVSGSSVPHLFQRDLVTLPVNLPPLEEQRRIAEVLDTIDETIQVTERVVAKLGSMQSGLIDRSFRRSQGTVAELGASCLGQGEYGCVAPAEQHRPGWPRYVRITDLTDTGTLRRDSYVMVSPSAVRMAILRSGDLVFARSGATVGKTYLYDPADGLCAFAGYLIRFRPDPTKALPEFVRWWTHSGSYWRWVKRTMREGAQPNINAQEYAKAVLPLPPIEEQHQIVKALDEVYAALKSERDLREKLRRLRSGLAADLLSGRVRTVAA